MAHPMTKYSWVFLNQLEKQIEKASKKSSGVVLDIGCGEKPYFEYFEKKCKKYVGLDLPHSPLAADRTADIFANALNIPFKNNTFDTVLCFEVLDDLPEPSELFLEINRTLKTNGFIILSVPQMWNIHNAPYDFYRYTRHGLQYQAEKHGLEVISITGVGGFWARVAAKTIRFIYRFGFNSVMRKVLEILIIPLQSFFYLLDSLFFTKDDVVCNLMVAKKSRPLSF